jgi:hypothetical protein
MAVTRKPQIQTPPVNRVDVEALILKGGSPAGEAPPLADKAGSKVSPVILRIPSDLLGRIENVRGARPVKIPRHTWLLEAIVEKLQREAHTSV